ncbi:MAG: PhnA protein, partial [Olleya sp.]
MSLQQMLQDRSNNACEICASTSYLKQYNIPPSLSETVDTSILICNTCHDQIEGKTDMDENHWRCLNDSMWSEHVA